jgi:hypothetical protein
MTTDSAQEVVAAAGEPAPAAAVAHAARAEAGLTDDQVAQLRVTHGYNEVTVPEKAMWWQVRARLRRRGPRPRPLPPQPLHTQTCIRT